jgi:hypothetical protein
MTTIAPAATPVCRRVCTKRLYDRVRSADEGASLPAGEERATDRPTGRGQAHAHHRRAHRLASAGGRWEHRQREHVTRGTSAAIPARI